MNKFSWKKALLRTKNPEKLKWLADNHHLPYTEEQYILIMKSFKEKVIAKQKRGKYSDYVLKKRYRYLQSKFGFFISNNKKHGLDKS